MLLKTLGKLNKHLREMTGFFFVGGVAVLADFIAYFFILESTNLSASFAKGISYVLGNVISFIGHRFFVFKAKDKSPHRQILPFALLYLSTFVINNIANELALSLTNARSLAWLFATSIAVVINYLGLKFIVFRKTTPTLGDN